VALPPAATSVEQALDDLRRCGLARMADVLSGDEVQTLSSVIADAAAIERATDRDYVYSSGSNQRVWMLPNYGHMFLELARHPAVLEVMEGLLGPEPLLSNLSANITGSGGQPMKPHWDQDWADRPWPMPLAAHAIWMLDDFTVENGATLVVPGSHLRDDEPDDSEMRPATGTAGSVLFMEARLWHGTGRNVSAQSRRIGVLAYYSKPYIRPQENYPRSLDPRIERNLDPQLRRLLGFHDYEYLNFVGGPPREEDRY
jgi:ectoine hydroxylase-related dioxygenase (phytanoyl-CoA dioxygenase family)